MTRSNHKYSNTKIVWFPEKLQSFVNNQLTAPIYVRIKPINACNHDCYWCVYHASKLSNMHLGMENKDIIKIDKMLEILDDLSEIGVEAVTYSGGGEPLLHPHSPEFLKKTLDNNIALSVITNGQFLKDENAEMLSDKGCYWVRVSMDYFDEESFSFSRKVPKKFYREIIKNISAFAKVKNRECDLSVNYIITKDNYQQLENITQIIIDCGVNNIRFSPMWISNFHEYHEPIKDIVFDKLDELRKHETDNFKIYSSYNKKAMNDVVTFRPYKKCYVMQYNPVIGADLNVYACHNQAYSNDSIIISLKNRRFKEAWFSKEAKEFHNSFECQKVCAGQCASDNKNLLIHDVLNSYGDSFV